MAGALGCYSGREAHLDFREIGSLNTCPWRIVISGNHRHVTLLRLSARLMRPYFILSMSLISKAFALDSIFGRDR
jgi:hypothetical protein